MQLNKAFREFIDSQYGAASPSTITWYEKKMAPLSHLKCKQVCNISESDLRQAWIELIGRQERWKNHPGRPSARGGLSPYTLAGYVRAWRAFFKWCVDRGYADRNPARAIKKPSLPDEPPKALLPEDLKLMLDASKDDARDYAILCFLADTGCRVGGLVSLTLGDLDLRNGRAIVREKGRNGSKRTRTVYMKPRTVSAVREYLKVRPSADNDRVFIGARGPLSEGGVYGMLKRLARRCGAKGRWNPHAFRHGFARAAVENGADLTHVSQLLGHRDIGVTARFYARWADDELKRKHREVSWLPDEEE